MIRNERLEDGGPTIELTKCLRLCRIFRSKVFTDWQTKFVVDKMSVRLGFMLCDFRWRRLQRVRIDVVYDKQKVEMEAFGIFEGGGAKGLAHIGALKAAEEADVKFIGVAGTSAGAIVASLVAAGFHADELYSPDNPNSLFNMNFTAFFDPTDWKNFLGILEGATSTFASGIGWFNLNKFLLSNRLRFRNLVEHGGWLQTSKFEQWLNEKLVDKIRQYDSDFEASGEGGCVTFADLKLPLKIIAADSMNRRMRVFTMPSDRAMSVSAAVGASISIPFVFRPVTLDGIRYVDGGIVSNFPAWVFDEEREKAPPLTPTLGFRLVERITPRPTQETDSDESLTAFSLVPHISSVFSTAIFGDNTLEKRAVETLHEIPLQVKIGPIDFNIDHETRQEVFAEARSNAGDYFRSTRIWRKSESRIKEILGIVEKAIRKELDHNGHLRFNIMLPVTNDTLRVVYSFNMDEENDCDDQLSFKYGCGACGHCWSTLTDVICDLADASHNYGQKWKMDKYQQRLVRRELRSLLCIPLFDERRLKNTRSEESEPSLKKRAFCGILNIDSDDDLLSKFSQMSKSPNGLAFACGAMISRFITSIHD